MSPVELFINKLVPDTSPITSPIKFPPVVKKLTALISLKLASWPLMSPVELFINKLVPDTSPKNVPAVTV